MIEKIKKMGDSEFSKCINEVIMSAPQDENYLYVTTPLYSNYGCFATNIACSVGNSLANDDFFAKGIEDKDYDYNRICFQYFSKEGIEIYNFIKEDGNICRTDFIYVFKGDKAIIEDYCSTISSVIEVILDESDCE